MKTSILGPQRIYGGPLLPGKQKKLKVKNVKHKIGIGSKYYEILSQRYEILSQKSNFLSLTVTKVKHLGLVNAQSKIYIVEKLEKLLVAHVGTL